jgi:hypothetical protein
MNSFRLSAAITANGIVTVKCDVTLYGVRVTLVAEVESILYCEDFEEIDPVEYIDVLFVFAFMGTCIVNVSKVKVSRDRPRWPKGFRVGPGFSWQGW